jgi:predicted dehydrogenase
MNQAIHMVDMLLYINGAPDEVFAFSGTLTHSIEVEDNLCAAIKYRNGSFGTIEVSTSCAPGFHRRVEFSGSGGTVAFEEDKITIWEFTTPQEGDDQIVHFCILINTANVSCALDDRKILDALSVTPQHGEEEMIQLAHYVKTVGLILHTIHIRILDFSEGQNDPAPLNELLRLDQLCACQKQVSTVSQLLIRHNDHAY